MMNSHTTSPCRVPVARSLQWLCCAGLMMICAACSDSEPSAAQTDTSGGAEQPAPTAVSPATGAPGDVPEDTAPAELRGSAVNDPDRVLRHAVFFSFKPPASEDDVQSVVDAFRALPEKIPEIVDFAWGVNNSPEGLNDGFTHCFLLSFRDEAGRAVYLPHEAHKAFGDVLRPHMDKVFVIDYWGKPPATPVRTPLHHAVFFRFADDASEESVKAVEDAFAALPGKIDTIKAFEWGMNNSPESHADGFTHCFLVTFDSEDGRAAYLPHPEHQAFVEVLKPVLDKVRVLDFAPLAAPE